LEKCPGPDNESLEEFKGKYDLSPIVAYGTVSKVLNDIVTLQISCVLKGKMNTLTIEVSQPVDVSNLTECHYLTTNKNYIVFIESMKIAGKETYQLAKLEEIEVNSNTAKTFLDDQCDDDEDFQIDMTIFYLNGINKCDKFITKCNEKTKTSILQLDYPPLVKSSTILGVFKETVKPPKDDDKVSGKSGAMSDETLRENAACSTIMMIPTVMIIAGLTMLIV